ncbi:Nudix hydrolase 9 [Glycine max]|nr:Nudix hydrolase 9 [Glycine max]
MEKEASSTDDTSSFTLLVSCTSGLSLSQVSVACSEAYDRIPHSEVSLENTISEIWEQRSQKNNSFFNGKKFRYGGYVLESGDGSVCEPHLCLHLGLTDYSNNVGEFPGHFVFPGGHPEPQEIGITSHQYDKELTESVNIKVSQEIFDSIVHEVVEEIGVPASSLSIPAFIGISRRNLNVRPAAFFSIKCNLDSKEVQQFYSSTQDGYESTQLYDVPMIEVENMTSRMPGFALYKLMVDTRKIT